MHKHATPKLEEIECLTILKLFKITQKIRYNLLFFEYFFKIVQKIFIYFDYTSIYNF